MKFLTLEQLPFTVLHKGFLAAFSDYSIKMEMSEIELNARLRRIAYQAKLSGGIVDGDTFCSFIFNGIGEYNGVKTAYNGGTGVIPAYRGKKLGTKVYQELFSLFQAQQIEQCLLEVITDNEKAVKLYKSLGFEISRLFKCYALNEKLEKAEARIPLQINQSELIDWSKYERFCTTQASWQNTFEAIQRDITQEIVLEAYSKTTLVGFLSFNDRNGKISQIAVSPQFRRAKVATNLIATVQKLSKKNCSILNVDANDQESCRFFEQLGFQNPIDQYEMILPLS